ncbi:hypothetical protein H310_00943 [Aphanomyces invadans]|uniref:Uncharacterized protein n=1 Tax=Aphanomyces invadans TaxID=157072 RepID=A0A024URT0_9STRA|nr:hypothetical protein H310_00943 [Aphanomyces invadans]ETW08333.1 hypothetical protein H310_00943 [Aphanomyces invadans]|eukprot:XP_008862138.1 hypothetical protein H310_00943 [Aphanomyces invadans]
MVRAESNDERGWVCHLCTKINRTDESFKCVCCGRPRDYVTKSVANPNVAKDLMLHGDLSTVTRPEQVHAMVRDGVLANTTSMDGLTGLHCAALHGQAAIVRALLQEGADIERPAPDGRRAIHFAAESGDAPTVQELLSWKAQVNVQSTAHGWTPLHVACSRGHAGVVEVLMRGGATATISTVHMHQTPLHFAAELGHVKCVEVLLQHSDEVLLKCVDRSGATAIQVAQFAHQAVVYELLYLHQSDSVLHDRMLDMLLTTTGSAPLVLR